MSTIQTTNLKHESSGSNNIVLDSSGNATASGNLTVSGNAAVSGNLTVSGTGNQSIAGTLQFNSGYGSVATAYGCRAWVSFNGQGTVAIRASGNVSSITDNGAGDYTVNFSTSMPDNSYSSSGWAMNGSGAFRIVFGASDAFPSSSAIRIATCDGTNAKSDSDYVHFQVFR